MPLLRGTPGHVWSYSAKATRMQAQYQPCEGFDGWIIVAAALMIVAMGMGLMFS